MTRTNSKISRRGKKSAKRKLKIRMAPKERTMPHNLLKRANRAAMEENLVVQTPQLQWTPPKTTRLKISTQPFIFAFFNYLFIIFFL